MSKKVTVLVCGGRDFADRDGVFRTLDTINAAANQITLLVHGGAPGADTLAGEWAKDRGIPCRVYPADWKSHGKAAGPKRNQQMLDEAQPQMVLAFPGGRGTADMVRRARTASENGKLILIEFGA